jgi:hypothetical protein
MRARVLGAVDGRIARHVLGLLVVLLAPAPAREHLVEEAAAKLRGDGARQRQEEERN